MKKTQYLKSREAECDFSDKGRKIIEIMGNLLRPSEYDGVIRVNGYYIAHTVGNDGEVLHYDLYDKNGNFIISHKASEIQELFSVVLEGDKK